MAPPSTAAARTAAPAAEPLSVVEYGGRRVLIRRGHHDGGGLANFDATIVHVALPTIEGNIRASTQAQETYPSSRALHAVPLSLKAMLRIR
jgi:hypothetical protein